MSQNDNKRGFRSVGSFRRPQPRFIAKPLILIVCEGEKTEPYYFEALCKHKGLTSANVRKVEICGEECDSHPKCVVDYAVELVVARRQKDKKNPYEVVWVCFDRDEHPNIHEAFDRAKAHKFEIAFSNPCFEIWYALHFKYSTGYVHRHAVQAEVNMQLKCDTKSDDVYHLIVDKQRVAVMNADKLIRHHESVGERDYNNNPYTTVHNLVTQLNEMSRSK